MDENQLAQLYQQYLGRAPDPSGIATWSGQDPSTVIAGILGSQEYQSRSGGGGGELTPIGVGGTIQPVEQNDAQSKVDQLYKSILGRSAKDDPGSQGWVTLLESGASLENIASAIGSSQEAKNRALSGVSEEVKKNDPNNFAGKVTELYASALGRTPEPKALEEYVNILNRNPDEFGWLSTHVTSSPEAQKYAEKTGINLDAVRENAVASYGLWTPAASSPTPGGLGGFFMKYGPYLPFAAAAAASAPALLAAEGVAAGTAAGTTAAGTAAGGAAGGTAASGLSGLYSSLPAWAQAAAKGAAIGGGVGGGVAGLTGGNVGQAILRGALIGGATGGITQGLSGVSAPTEPSLFSSDLAQLAKTYPGLSEQQLIDIANINYGVDTFTAADAARLAATGYSPATIDQVLGYSYSPTELAGTGITSMANTLPSPSLFDTASKILSSPLGKLGVMGGMSLLGGGGQQQQPVPQMAGGGGTYAPKGMVDYTPILTLLAPKQISRNSLLG